MTHRQTGLHIDLAALQHNLTCVKQHAPQSAVLAMVKANAYGHGIETVANALHAADALGVACLEEAAGLRAHGIRQPIVLMEGFFNAAELPAIDRLQLDIVVHDFTQLDALDAYTAARPLTAWLKIDTGMHRLGFSLEEAPTAWQRLNSCPAIAPPPKLMTHFANADTRASTLTTDQLDRFTQITAALPGERSLANSAGILAWPKSHADWVRPGIMLYGISPFNDCTGEALGLKPVMTLYSELIAVRHVKRGSPVGYGGQWVCPDDMPVGIVAIGYGDGYPRQLPNGTPVLVNNHSVPLIGRVSMDMLAVDLRSQPLAVPGAPVVLWGAGLPVETIARHAQTLAYELVCRMTAPRLKRTYSSSNEVIVK